MKRSVKMSIQEKRAELVELIDSIKEHSDYLSTMENIPSLELGVILSKINRLQEKVSVLRYLCRENHQSVTFKESSTLASTGEDLEGEHLVEESGSEHFLPNLQEETLQQEETPQIEQEEQPEDIVETPLAETTTVDSDYEENTAPQEAQDTLSPSEDILGAILEEVKEEEAQEVSQTESVVEPKEEVLDKTEPLDIQQAEPSEEELMEKIEGETELNALPDLNESLSEADNSLSGQLQKQPIADLMSAIGLNERYLYANELFDGDMDEFKNAMTMLNEFKTGEEARAFFENGLRTSYAWEDDNVLAQALFSLVERRFQ